MSVTFLYDVGDIVNVILEPRETRFVRLEEPIKKLCSIGSLRWGLGRKEYLLLVKWYFEKPNSPTYTYDQEEIWMSEDRLEKVQINESAF